MPPSLTSPNNRLPTGPWARTAVLGILIGGLTLAAVELGLRRVGYEASVNDDAQLWALEYRDRPDDAWLTLGSSRIACAFDLDTFEEVTGEPVVQLGISSGQPIAILTYLNEQGFDGKLIVEVSPYVWFTDNPLIAQQAVLTLQTLHDQERALLGGLERRATRVLQSQLRILHSETDLFDLAKAVVKRARPVIRQSVRGDRQRYCWPSRYALMPDMPMPDESLAVTERAPKDEASFDEVTVAIQGIMARGGTVLLFAAPEAGDPRDVHLLSYPESVYAEVLAERTGAPYVNTMTDPTIGALAVPDYSHIDASDAPLFTERLVELYREKGYFLPD